MAKLNQSNINIITKSVNLNIINMKKKANEI